MCQATVRYCSTPHFWEEQQGRDPDLDGWVLQKTSSSGFSSGGLGVHQGRKEGRSVYNGLELYSIDSYDLLWTGQEDQEWKRLVFRQWGHWMKTIWELIFNSSFYSKWVWVPWRQLPSLNHRPPRLYSKSVFWGRWPRELIVIEESLSL